MEVHDHEKVRKSILEAIEKCVCGGRPDANGKPENTSEIICDFWNVYLKNLDGRKLNESDVNALMVLLKVARIVNNYGGLDSWIDAAGYAVLGADATIKQNEQNNKEKIVENG